MYLRNVANDSWGVVHRMHLTETTDKDDRFLYISTGNTYSSFLTHLWKVCLMMQNLFVSCLIKEFQWGILRTRFLRNTWTMTCWNVCYWRSAGSSLRLSRLHRPAVSMQRVSCQCQPTVACNERRVPRGVKRNDQASLCAVLQGHSEIKNTARPLKEQMDSLLSHENE